MNLRSEDVLFIGRGSGVVPWYRTGMPAFHLGCDWVGMSGTPPDKLNLESSLKRGGHSLPVLDNYKIVIVQQASGPEWLKLIRHLQARDIRVIYEIDDYIHGVQKIQSHRARPAFAKAKLKQFELCMSAADALIVSTDWLATRYRKFNPNVYVCENSVDTRLYNFELPKRDTINIGWAGGEGHLESVRKWLPAVEKILIEFPETRFISMGLPVAHLTNRPEQSLILPFISIENFPAAMTSFDIAIAPAGRGNFFAGKSDLRFLETGALGIPLVADPFVYSTIEDGDTGLLAETPQEVEDALRLLVTEEGMRKPIGASARSYVREHRDIKTAIEQWEEVFVAVWDQ